MSNSECVVGFNLGSARDAPIQAAMRADAMLEAGDLEGYAVWKRILRALDST
jgi:hypothetical protein